MTPIYLKFKGYSVGWFSNEGGEPPHVHVFRGADRNSSAKWWIRKEGLVLADNKARFSKQELKLIERYLASNRDMLVARWFDFFA